MPMRIGGRRSAVNDRVIYLDRSLFHYKPNARYAEAYMELAKILYPATFS